MINIPELLNKCYRCKKSNVNLIEISIMKNLGKENIQSYQINFSVCESCIKKYNEFLSISNKYRISTIFFFCIFIITLITFIATILINYLISVSIIIIFLISGSIRLKYYLNIENHPENLDKYIEIQETGIIVIKDPLNQKNPFKINIIKSKEAIFEETQKKSLEICPNCGAKQKTYTGFCSVCGKNLKVIKDASSD